MSRRVGLLTLIFYVFINYCHSSLPEDVANISAECLTNSLETSLYCRGSRVINNIINNLSKTKKPIVIVRGLEIVPSNHPSNNTAHNVNKSNINEAVGVGEADKDNDTLLGRFSQYLRTHELNIKFSDLMSSEKSERFSARVPQQNGIQISLLDEARKKDKGNGMLMAVGLMMSKAMAVMGLGGIGALAMKALGIAMTALMMATMVGVKSMTQHGNEASHSVQYVTADGHHHRRRRRRRSIENNHIFSDAQKTLFKENDNEIELPSLVYKGWQKE